MKRNTGCGYGHNGCPPQPRNDRAKSESLYTNVTPFSTQGDTENNVVLADVFVQTLTEADFYLPTYARDIKHIKKNVFLTQCKVIPVVDNPAQVKLFIDGYVHKNIQYVESSYGVVKDYSIDVPFRAFSLVDDLANDVAVPFGFEYSVKDNVLQRRELADDGMGADRCEFGSITFEINNEPIRCKLLASAVNQLDLVKDFDNWGRFKKVTEKLDITLAIKLTQKQQPGLVPFPDNGAAGVEPTAIIAAAPETIYSRFRSIIGQ